MLRFGTVIALFFTGFIGCVKQEKVPCMPIYDILTESEEMPVKLNPALFTNMLPVKDLQGISSALGRTPGVKYEIKSLTLYPTNDFPMVARVQVERSILFLCRSRDDNWHVFRVAEYIVDTLPSVPSLVP